MASEPSPAFLFYVKDWRSSRKVQSMNFAARGMYLEMLLEQWENGSVPGTPSECAALLGGTSTEWQRAWPKLKACFTTKKRSGRSLSNGGLVNWKLEEVRLDRLRYQKAQRESGLRGAEARWKQHGKPIGSPSKPIGSPMAKNGSSSSSAFAFASAFAKEDGTRPAPTAPTARSKRPIFKGQRLVVFEWMLDDLAKMLGSHTDDFDLHAWFSTLDARMVAAAVVIPQRDGGAWLQGQTLTEAQRRGLPLAVNGSGSTVGKQTTRLAAAVENIQREEAQS